MWPSKMFLLPKDRSGLGRTRGRRTWEGGRVGLFCCFLKLFVTFMEVGDHTEGRPGGNYNPWFRLSYIGKDTFLVGSHAKKEKENPLIIMHRLRYVSQQAAFWSASPVMDTPACQAAWRTHFTKALFPKASFLLEGYKTISVTNRRVFNTLTMTGFREFHSFVML